MSYVSSQFNRRVNMEMIFSISLYYFFLFVRSFFSFCFLLSFCFTSYGECIALTYSTFLHILYNINVCKYVTAIHKMVYQKCFMFISKSKIKFNFFLFSQQKKWQLSFRYVYSKFCLHSIFFMQSTNW